MPSQLGEDSCLLSLLARQMQCLGVLRDLDIYISDDLNVSDLLQNADEDLLHKMQKPQHCLHHLLPPVHVVDTLRERGHPFTLPEYNTVIHKKSFV